MKKNIFDLLEELKEIYGADVILGNLVKYLPINTVADFVADFVNVYDYNWDDETGENFKIILTDNAGAKIKTVE